jgi:hypothetical protein
MNGYLHILCVDARWHCFSLLLGRNDEAKKMYLEAEKMCREPDTKVYYNLGE